MQKKTILDLLNTAGFLLLLAVLLLSAVLREKETYSYYENRNLASAPTASVEGILDGSYFSAAETCLADHAPGRRTALKLRTFTDLHILRRPVVNDTVIVRDEHLLLPFTEHEYDAGTLNPSMIADCAGMIADNLRVHADAVESYGGYFCYAAVPCQYVCYEDAYSDYLNNRRTYTERSTAALFAELDAHDIPYIDLRAVYETGEDLRESSSTVDNHYSISGAFMLYREIVGLINRDTDLAMDVPREEDFVLTVRENPYMGSRIRKLCGLWESGERLGLMEPAEKIPFTRYNGGKAAEAAVYSLPYNRWEPLLYNVYMGGDIAECRIDTERQELPSILVYGDSFTNALECVLWTGFDEMYSYDFRYYKERPLDEIIAEYQPEVVVCVRDYQAILNLTGNGI